MVVSAGWSGSDGFPGFGPRVGQLVEGPDAVTERVGGVFVRRGALADGLKEQAVDVAVSGVEPGEFGGENEASGKTSPAG